MFRESLSLVKTAAIAVAFIVGGSVSPVFAAGGGSSGTTEIVCRAPLVPNEQKTACIPCAEGATYNAQTKTCIADNASLIDDQQLYQQGHDLALAGQYERALDFLGAIRDKDDAMVLTMIGYATRKLGNTEEGIAIYHQALAIDPNNVNTHEYLGEGYVAAGRIDLAELELDTLAKLCGTECEQYQDLAKAIAGDPVWN